ncbi:MAG: PilZ domain-containing protein [Thermoanaerobaculales bacterium]|nr:PilZ domain-containing protein [Thermoanaerobaculales bacterium]
MSPNSDSHDLNQTSGGNLKIIDLEFETLRQFREVMAPRLNYEGAFVATNDPLPKGTPVRFRFLLPDGFVLVEGTAVVAWARYEDELPDLRAGMALLFNELEHQSREIIDELIDFHIATGGDPFDIGPTLSGAGDIGTDALAGDPLETKVPLPEPEPTPDPPKPKDKGVEAVLPDWLSEVAQKNDFDFSTDATVPVGQTAEPEQIAEAAEPAQQEFEISLMPDEEKLDQTPTFVDNSDMPEVMVPPPEERKAPKDLRLRPLLAVVAALAVAAVVVWWIANRRPALALPEPAVVVEEIPPSEAPVDEAEEPAEMPVDTAVEGIDESSVELLDVPSEVSEAEPETARIEEVAGPATRVLLIAASRVGDATVVTVRTNGELPLEAVRVSLLKDPARVWIRILGIETFYRPNDIEIGTQEVERIRVGHHPEETPQSLYVVCDLEDPAAVVREHTVEGETLRVVVGRP